MQVGVGQGLGAERPFHARRGQGLEAQKCETVQCMWGAQAGKLVRARAKGVEKPLRPRF